MSSVNKVFAMGNLGADPEIRHTPGGQATANFRMACTEKWKDKQGQQQERTEWVRVVAWGRLAELCGEYLKKGRQAFVEGRMQTREWQDKDGNKRQTTEVVASNVVFLGGGKDGGRGQSGGGDFGGGSDYGSGGGYGSTGGDDPIPF